MKKFSLIGAAGFVAPRHFRAIKDTGNQLVSIFDIHDKMSAVDNYFPKTACFSSITDYRNFHNSSQNNLDFVSICSPNHLHFEQIEWAIGKQSTVICEKPLVLLPNQLDYLSELEHKFQRNIYTILQLRLLDSVRKLKSTIETANTSEKYKVDITYISARGNWYFNAWKGNEEKSGGLMTNIGIHLFDLLLWLFGPVEKNILHHSSSSVASGFLELEKAKVSWFLSVDAQFLPPEIESNQKQSFRSLTVNGDTIRLDEGFENLHTLSYQEIFNGNGARINTAAPSIQLCHTLRHQKISDEGQKHKILIEN
jgi:UDP-N-acetyl-2-amino-2-deoxyglucuronate dehydrogenase